MNARKVAAQFAAHVWFENARRGKARPEEIARFARENWRTFLPLAQEGLGRLLIKIAGPRVARSRLKAETVA
jgi:hypothetical protein